jgi:hypothetical protein
VNDVVPVRAGESLGHADDDLNSPLERKRARFHAVAQRLSLNQFHDDIGLARLGLAVIVDGRDVLVIERGSGAGLAQEAGASLVLIHGREEFDRDVPAEVEILGSIDDPHPASAEQAENAVMGNVLADHGSSRHDACMPTRLGNELFREEHEGRQ